MGIAKKTDGRYVVGVGVDNANDYKGSAAYRDIYIQLTSSGATAKSEEYLTFLKDYAVNANALGEPIMPPSVNVWISNNGVTTAVEADDVSIDGNNYTICGIKWNGSAWDYSGAGQGKSGSGLPSYTSADKGKVLTIGEGEGSVTTVIVPEQTVTQTEGPIPLTGVDVSGFAVGVSGIMTINGTEYNVTAEESVGGAIAFPALEAEVIIVLDNGVVTLGTPNPGTYTVSLSASVPSVEPKWEAAGGAFIINVSGVPGGTLTPDKTYPELTEAISGGAIPVVLLGGGSIALEYSAKNGYAYKFERLSANTNGSSIDSLVYMLGEYDQGGFTFSMYNASL